MSAAPCRTAPSEALSARFRRTLACAGLWLTLVATAAAAPPAQLGPGDQELDLLPHLSVLEDPGKSLQLEDLLTS
ncbi:MAG TPA: hypothetical protein VIM90_11745, partial [Arenimonas sp.]